MIEGYEPNQHVLYVGQSCVLFSSLGIYNLNMNRHSGRFKVDTGILFRNMKSPSHEC